MRENCEDCPEFDDFDYEKVLTWAAEKHEATVTWDDEVIDSKGNRTSSPKYAMWALSWNDGVIGMDHLPHKEDEEKARKTAALFIYLWSCGVTAMIAHHCADQYVKHLEFERL